jgi:hypothetical protein
VYWLPSWVERHEVRWQSVYTSPAQPISLLEALLPSRLTDLSAVNPTSTNALGAAVWVLALLVVVVVGRQAWQRTPSFPRAVSRGEAFQWRLTHFWRCITHQETEALYFVLVGGVLLFAATQVFWLWDNSPDWAPINPQDVLLVVITCWAIGAAQLGHRLGQSRRMLAAAGVEVALLALVVIMALPVLYPPVWPERHFTPDLSTVLLDETRGYSAGSQVAGILLPRSVQEMPSLSRVLIESYQSQMVDKVARDLLPPATQVDIIEHQPQSDRLVTRSSNDTVLTLLTFNYPGWRAKIDNKSVHVTSGTSSGFISLKIPAGRHEVEVYFGPTEARVVGWILALGMLLAVGIVSLRNEYFSRGQRVVLSTGESTVTMPGVHYAVFLMAALLFGAGGMVTHLAPEWFTIRSPRGEVSSGESFPLALQGGIDLLGYDIEGDGTFTPGDEIVITLYWRAVRPDLPDYQVNVSIMGDDFPNQVSFVQHRHPGMIPSSQWSSWPLLDYYVRDVYYIPLPDDAVLGRYQISAQVGPCSQATILPCENIDPLFVRDGRGASLGQRIVLPDVIELAADK